MRAGHFISVLTGAVLIASVVTGKEPPREPDASPQTTVTIVNKSGVEVTGIQHGIPDPRSGPSLTILYKNQKDSNQSLSDALMVCARHDANPPNEILDVKGSFTDDQIMTALRKFYAEWRAPAGTGLPRPKLILAMQNWGCGAGLFEPLKRLSADFEIDVYQLNPVITQIESKPGHPTANDKRLGEILNGD